MASAQSAKMGSLVSPAAPEEAQPADDAVTGEVSKYTAPERTSEAAQEQTKAGKPDPEKKGWIEVMLVDENGKGIAGEEFEVTTSDNQVFSRTTNDEGWGRVDGIEEGTCKVTFPRFDAEAWELA